MNLALVMALNSGNSNMRYSKRGTPLADKLGIYSEPELNTGCVLWHGAANKLGYGTVLYEGKTLLAHRASWSVRHGELRADLCVCHRCDTPACINPDHLFLGTHRDNQADMDAKGRRVLPDQRGARNPFAKLTQEDILEIRALYSRGLTQYAIAEQFGVRQTHVSLIVRRKTWAWVTEPDDLPAVGSTPAKVGVCAA